jgi:hypothetical protein
MYDASSLIYPASLTFDLRGNRNALAAGLFFNGFKRRCVALVMCGLKQVRS